MSDIIPIGSRPGDILAGYSTPQQLAKKINKCEATIRRWERLGLRVIKRGNMWIYSDYEVREFLTNERPAEPRGPGRPPKRRTAG